MRTSPSLRCSIGLDEACGVLVGWSSQPGSLGVEVALVGVDPGVFGPGVEVGLLEPCLTPSKWTMSS